MSRRSNRRSPVRRTDPHRVARAVALLERTPLLVELAPGAEPRLTPAASRTACTVTTPLPSSYTYLNLGKVKDKGFEIGSAQAADQGYPIRVGTLLTAMPSMVQVATPSRNTQANVHHLPGSVGRCR